MTKNARVMLREIFDNAMDLFESGTPCYIATENRYPCVATVVGEDFGWGDFDMFSRFVDRDLLENLNDEETELEISSWSVGELLEDDVEYECIMDMS